MDGWVKVKEGHQDIENLVIQTLHIVVIIIFFMQKIIKKKLKYQFLYFHLEVLIVGINQQSILPNGKCCKKSGGF
jgi:hypothetical protein